MVTFEVSKTNWFFDILEKSSSSVGRLEMKNGLFGKLFLSFFRPGLTFNEFFLVVGVGKQPFTVMSTGHGVNRKIVNRENGTEGVTIPFK